MLPPSMNGMPRSRSVATASLSVSISCAETASSTTMVLSNYPHAGSPRPCPRPTTTTTPAPRCLRIAAAGDIHCSEEPRGGGHRRPGLAGRARRPGAARRRSDHPRRARAGARCSRARARDSTSRCSPCSATTIGTPTATMSSSPRLAEGGITVLDARLGDLPGGRAPTSGSSASRASSAAFPGSHLPDFGEPSLRGHLRRDLAATSRRWTAACARSPCARRASCSCTTRPARRPSTASRSGIWAFLGTDRLAAPDRRARAGPRRARPRPRRHVRGRDRRRCRSTTSRCR